MSATQPVVRYWIVGELMKEADPVEAVRSILALLDLTEITRSRLVSWTLTLLLSNKQEALWYFQV